MSDAPETTTSSAPNVCIGIDLGTTYSCVGVWKNNQVEILDNTMGNRTTPSYVAFSGEEKLIGDAAKNQVAMNSSNTVFDAKRLIGRLFTDTDVQNDMKHWPFKVIDSSGAPRVQVEVKGETKDFAPEEISSMVLTYMKEVAEQRMGHEITKAVITVPAYFNDQQRSATKDAGALAGLEVMRIINEPTAAAIAYGLNKNEKKANVLIFDLGGGTFDVSLLTIENGIFAVKATAGNTHLGGEDFDNSMVDHFADEIKRKLKKDIKTNARALRRLRTACERAKRTLSTATQADIELESLLDGEDYVTSITRARFEQLNEKLFNECIEPVQRVLKDAKMKASQVDDIVLVGGSTRIPKVQAMLSELFNGKELCRNINPDEAVAYGAAVQGAILTNSAGDATRDLLLLDVTPLSLGVEVEGGAMSVIIKRNTPIPCEQTQSYTTLEDNQTEIEFKVFEGERPRTADNNLLGEFNLNQIQAAKRGVPKIKVNMSIDANGILSVVARDEATGKSASVTIKDNRGRLSKEEIEEMLETARRNNASDAAMRKAQESRSKLEHYLYEVQEQIEVMDEMANGDKENIYAKVEELMEWMSSVNLSDKDVDASAFVSKQKELDTIVTPAISRYNLKMNKAGHRQRRGGRR